jgi:hypothetical protein
MRGETIGAEVDPAEVGTAIDRIFIDDLSETISQLLDGGLGPTLVFGSAM